MKAYEQYKKDLEKFKEIDQIQKNQIKEWYKAKGIILDEIQEQVKKDFSDFDGGIYINDDYGDYEIGIRFKKKNESPLRWDMEIRTGRTHTKINSNSWSGIKVNSIDDITTLKKDLEIMERICNTDFKQYLKEMPKFEDYVDKEETYIYCPRFPKAEILSEICGKNEWIKIENDKWMKVEKETDKFYTIEIRYSNMEDIWFFGRKNKESVLDMMVTNEVIIKEV